MTREQKTAFHVRVHQRVVLLDAGVDQILVVPCPCVVDQDVEPAELLHRQRHALLRSGFVRAISGMKYGSSAADADQIAKLAQPLFAPRRHHDVRALRSEPKRRRPPDPRTGSGNKDGLSREADGIRHDGMAPVDGSGDRHRKWPRKPIWMLLFRLCPPSTPAPNIAPA